MSRPWRRWIWAAASAGGFVGAGCDSVLGIRAYSSEAVVFTDVTTTLAVSAAVLKVCASGDVPCENPIVPPGTTDKNGAVTFVLPSISPAGDTTVEADFGDGGVPFAYFLNDPLTRTATSTPWSGFAVLLNAPVTGPATVTVMPQVVGRVEGIGTMFARAGTISFMGLGAK